MKKEFADVRENRYIRKNQRKQEKRKKIAEKYKPFDNKAFAKWLDAVYNNGRCYY